MNFGYSLSFQPKVLTSLSVTFNIFTNIAFGFHVHGENKHVCIILLFACFSLHIILETND